METKPNQKIKASAGLTHPIHDGECTTISSGLCHERKRKMKTEAKHTAEFPRGVIELSEDERWTNAGHIVHCVNCHDEMLEALKAMVGHLSKMEGGKWLNNRTGEMAKQALTKAAEGGE